MQMKRLIYLFLLPLLSVACTDSETVAPSPRPVTRLSVPVQVMGGNGTRAAVGDPGVDGEAQPPENIYVFAWMKTDANTYEFIFHRQTELAPAKWSTLAIDPGEGTDYSARYELNDHIVLNFTRLGTGLFPKNERIGQIYVFGTNVPVANDVLKTKIDALCQDFSYDNADDYRVTGISATDGAAIDGKIRALTLDCSAYTSEQFRDLYSSPWRSDGRKDDTNLDNGVIAYNDVDYASDNITVLTGDVRLYHAAAKIDFKWEVPATMQNNTAVGSITVSSLPTVCTIFDPTHNTTGTATETLTTDKGSQWLGREYFHALQPADGNIAYQVTFKDPSTTGTDNKSVSATFVPAVKHEVFTGWYRINATVK